MKQHGVLQKQIERLKAGWDNLLDPRKTSNGTKYSMGDIAMGAFGVFFTQSPSFLAYQTDLQKGQNSNEGDMD